MVRVLLDVGDFARSCWRRVSVHYGYYCYSYGSYRRKVLFDPLKLEELVDDVGDGVLSSDEVLFFLKLVTMLRFGRDFEGSAVVRVTQGMMRGFCSSNTYGRYLDRLVGYGVLVRTSHRNYFIVDPRYVHKFYRTRVDKVLDGSERGSE